MSSSSPLTSESERVTRLRAACIRTLLLRRGIPISDDKAVQLARIHTIRAAITRIQASIDVQLRVLDRERAIEHSVQETILNNDTEKIITIRQVLEDTTVRKTQDVDSTEKLQRELWNVKHEFSSWSRDYATFLADVQNLYMLRVEQINVLQPSTEKRGQAIEELNALFEAAIRRSV
jgi:hypothetical protein